MDHGDATTRRAARSPAAPPRRHGAGTARWVVTLVGLAVTAAVGTATVTAVLLESHQAPRPSATRALVDPAPGPGPGQNPDPAMLRLWGLRAPSHGVLAPLAIGEEVPRTALEQLYDDLLPPARP